MIRSTHPVLLVTSDLHAPIWISPKESLRLAVGKCNFTCCETNHRGPRGDSKITCSRKNVRIVLDRMIEAKANHLFKENNVVYGRLTRVLKHWWLRGLTENVLSSVKSEDDFETWLKWDKTIDGDFFDRNGVGLLIYAASANNLEMVKYLLEDIQKNFKDNPEEKQRRIECRITKKGFLDVGIPGSCTSLIGAMAFASSEMVQLLLESGANPYATEINGDNSLMCACSLNRVENVKFWLKEFPDWNLEARNKIVGGIALGLAVYMGPNRHDLTKVLLEHGANVLTRTYTGSSILMNACDNVDCDPEVVRLILENVPPQEDLVNYRGKSRTLKWKFIKWLANVSVRYSSNASRLFKEIARGSGSYALLCAAHRGDMEVVEILLNAGADPSMKNDLGQDAAALCMNFPELRGMLEKRERKMKLRLVSRKMTDAVEVLGKRISTATPIQHKMWLISLDNLLMLYGNGSHGHVMEVHEVLKRQKFLASWCDVPADAESIFVRTHSYDLSLICITQMLLN